MEQYAIPALITVFTCAYTFYLAFSVGMTRMKHKSWILEKSQHKDVEKANRVHMNAVENIILFLPLLWIGSIFLSEIIFGVLGSIWLLARVWYSYAYMQDPAKRQNPFMIQFVTIIIMALGAIYGIII